MLRKVYSGQTPQAIIDFDVEAMFARIELAQHLSMGRRNGLSEMVKRIKVLATTLAAG
jgi:sulfur transfer protein SufE